jgi:hypothetical protein
MSDTRQVSSRVGDTLQQLRTTRSDFHPKFGPARSRRPMSDSEVSTGVYTFPLPGDPQRRQFGMVGASVREGHGTLTVIFRHLDAGISVALDESSVTLTIPEDFASVAFPILCDVLAKLAALHAGDREPSA